jgi:hypothetical protein
MGRPVAEQLAIVAAPAGIAEGRSRSRLLQPGSHEALLQLKSLDRRRYMVSVAGTSRLAQWLVSLFENIKCSKNKEIVGTVNKKGNQSFEA